MNCILPNGSTVSIESVLRMFVACKVDQILTNNRIANEEMQRHELDVQNLVDKIEDADMRMEMQQAIALYSAYVAEYCYSEGIRNAFEIHQDIERFFGRPPVKRLSIV